MEKPLPLVFPDGVPKISSPKDALKLMLESSLLHEEGKPTPLDEIDPMALDELVNRIDTGALALNQVPDPNDIEKLVQYYWSLRTKHNMEVQLGIVSKPRARAGKKTTIAVLDLLDDTDNC